MSLVPPHRASIGSRRTEFMVSSGRKWDWIKLTISEIWYHPLPLLLVFLLHTFTNPHQEPLCTWVPSGLRLLWLYYSKLLSWILNLPILLSCSTQPKAISFSRRFEGTGYDNEYFSGAGCINPLPAQHGMPGFKSMTMMKFCHYQKPGYFWVSAVKGLTNFCGCGRKFR